MQKLLSKIVKIRVLKAASDITAVDFSSSDNHLDDLTIMVGLVTKQCLRRLLDGGDITDNGCKNFYSAVRAFYMDAASQALKKLPFTDDVLNHARFLNFEKKEKCVLSIP